MLKITIVDDSGAPRLVLEGRLTQPEIPTLKSVWDNARAAGRRRCTVDLRGTTYIDGSGERLLLEMKEQGARFVACGISTTHRLAQLGIVCENGTASQDAASHFSKS